LHWHTTPATGALIFPFLAAPMKRIGRNDPWPCGSGKKYKQCCMQREETQAAGRRAESASIPKAIQAGLEQYQAGRLPQAEAIY
jgi:SEC-C motif